MNLYNRLWNDRRQRRAAIWLALLGTLFFVFSVCTLIPLFYEKGSALTTKIPICCAFGFIAVGMLLGVQGWRCYRSCVPKGRGPAELLDPMTSDATRPVSKLALGASVVLTVLCLLIYILVEGDRWSAKPSVFHILARILGFFLNNPGGIFAFLTGIATLVGTYLALHSIFELRHTITSFPQLVSCVISLIEETDDPEDQVRFFSYSPLPGAFNAAVGKRLTQKLRDVLVRRDTRIRMACLDKQSHSKWIGLFGPPPEVATKFENECESVLQILSGRRYRQPGGDLVAKDKYYQPIRLKWGEMPGYYFFASARRAIVVVPVKMPRIGNPVPKGLGVGVDTLGFETTDDRVIQMLINEFDRYRSMELVDGDVENVDRLVDRLQAGRRPLDAFLWKLSDDQAESANLQSAILKLVKDDVAAAKGKLLFCLNRRLSKLENCDAAHFEGVESAATGVVRRELGESPSPEDVMYAYRLLLADAYQGLISSKPHEGKIDTEGPLSWHPGECNFIV